MIRSVLKLSPDELKRVLSLLTDKKDREKLKITSTDREMLEELKDVLGFFEQFTDQLKSDKVSISKVYPSVSGLKVYLICCNKYDHSTAIKFSTIFLG